MKHQQGFTLVEMSISVVIIGLIVASVLGTQSFIRHSKIRNLISDYQNYSAAINSFRYAYGNLPGDTPKASTFGFGGANGDGDGLLEDNGPAAGVSDTHAGEITSFWIHLGTSGAGILDKNYSGGFGGSHMIQTQDHVNSLLPKDSFGGSWGIAAENPEHKHTFVLGIIPDGGSGKISVQRYLPPIVAYNIDEKIDNGVPGTGLVVARGGEGNSHCCNRVNVVPTYDKDGDATSCAYGTEDNFTPSTAAYNLNFTNNECRLNMFLK